MPQLTLLDGTPLFDSNTGLTRLDTEHPYLKGRMRRRAYVIRMVVAAAVAYPAMRFLIGNGPYTPFGILAMLPVLFLVLTSTIRRLHDLDRIFLWFMVLWVPIAGLVLLGFLFFKEGTIGPNRFGPDPKRPELT